MEKTKIEQPKNTQKDTCIKNTDGNCVVPNDNCKKDRGEKKRCFSGLKSDSHCPCKDNPSYEKLD